MAYVATTRPPEAVKENLATLGVDVPTAIRAGHLNIDDWYTATLTGGRIEAGPGKVSLYEPIEGGSRIRSLKVADLSVEWLRASKQGWSDEDVIEAWPPGALGISESASSIMRFNDEGIFLDYVISRGYPNERRGKRIYLAGVARGVHSEFFYRRHEEDCDGIIDLRVMEKDDEVKTLLRVRSLKGQPHDTHWHEIEIKPNGEASVVS